MKTMFEAKMNMVKSSAKAFSCQQNASFNHAMVRALSTMLLVLILVLIISVLHIIIRSNVMVIIIMCAIGCKSKPKKLVLTN